MAVATSCSLDCSGIILGAFNLYLYCKIRDLVIPGQLKPFGDFSPFQDSAESEGELDAFGVFGNGYNFITVDIVESSVAIELEFTKNDFTFLNMRFLSNITVFPEQQSKLLNYTHI